MFINYVDSIVYVAILCTIGASLGITGLYMLISKMILPLWIKTLRKVDKNRSNELKKIHKKYFKLPKKVGKIVGWYMVIGVIAFGVMFGYRQEYTLADEFVWKEEEQIGQETQTFCVVERTDAKGQEWWKNAIRLSWLNESCELNEAGDIEISKKTFAYYYNHLASDYTTKGERVDTRKTLEDVGEDYNESKNEFEEIQNKTYSQLSPEQLWNGYKAGKKVCECINTSENIYHTGLLAEAAHARVFVLGEVSEETILYLAGAMVEFDEFEQFGKMRIGVGTEISKTDTYFNKGKMMYRECVWGKQIREVKIHCGMMAYTYFDILAQNVDANSPQAMTYIFYAGRTCLDILPYISDEELQKELCRRQLRYWENLEEQKGANYISQYKVEKKNAEELTSVKKQLEHNVNN